jgi:hypothetical protein
MRGRLTVIETKRQHGHLEAMTTQKSEAAKAFKKPAHWTNDPVPAPKPVEVHEKLSPTRYGDWEKDGIAVDF